MISASSAFASDLRLNGFPQELTLSHTLTLSNRILRLMRIERDRENDVTCAVYNDVRNGSSFTIWNT